jgi:hypothetical protein
MTLGVAVSLAAGVLSLGAGGPTQETLRPVGRHAATKMSNLPTTVSGRYTVAGTVSAFVRVGGMIYVGGDFTRIARRTGSAIIVPARGGTPEPVRAEIAGGSVRDADGDGSGGWYVGGSFTTVGDVRRAGLAHLRPDGLLDPAFTPPELGEIHTVALSGSVLYVGGIERLQRGTRPVLRALDAATGAALPITYAAPEGADAVLDLLVNTGRLYAAVGVSGVVAYDAASGKQFWAHPHTCCDGDEGAATLALYGHRLLVGGEFEYSGGENLEVLDVASGRLVGRPLTVKPSVAAIAVVGGTVYVARPAASGVSTVDLGSGRLRSWGAIRASMLEADGSTLYVAGWTSRDGYAPRLYATRTGATHAALRPRSPSLDEFVLTLAAQGGHVLVGGSFTGAGGAARNGLAAFDARTGALRGWHPRADSPVNALAVAGRTIYVGGSFRHLSGKPRSGLAAVSTEGTGRLLPWRPRLAYVGTISALAVGRGRVFVGGSSFRLHRPVGPRFVNLVAFSAAGAGSPVPFSSRVGEVHTLAVWRDTLLVGSKDVIALSAGGDGRQPLWHRRTSDIVFALATRGTTLYAGGRFSLVNGQRRHNLAAFALNRRGELLPFAPRTPIQVMALAPLGPDLVFGGFDLNGRSRQVLGAVTANGTLEPWRVDTPGTLTATVEHIASIPDGLLVAGSFAWLGPTGHQAARGIGWLR